MANEIVKFSNQFNNQALRKFTALDLDLLMSIASKVRDQGTGKVEFTFDELRKLTRLRKNLTNGELARQIVDVNARLLALNFTLTDGNAIVQFALFQTFRTDPEAATLTVAVHPDFAFLLNDLTSQFTRFELTEFTDLRSSYAKELYRRLKQFRTTGVWSVDLDEFRRLLDVPASYKTCDLNKRVIAPIVEELGPLIHLKVERRYSRPNSGKGRSALSGFTFRFDKETAPRRLDPPATRPTPTPPDHAPVARMSAEDRERLEAERRAHGGSMFAGSAGYVDVPLID